MRYIFATVLGILDVLIQGPLDAVFGFFGWGPSLSRNVIEDIAQDRQDANWRREFLAQKQLEKNNRNPFLNQHNTKAMMWGRSSVKKKQ